MRKLCRYALPYESLFPMGIRLCWLATYACQNTDLQAMRCLPPALIRVTCSRITPRARRMTAPAWRGRSNSSGPATCWSCGISTARPLAVAPARHRDLAQGQSGGVPLADREPGHHDALGRNSCSRCGALAQYERADPGACCKPLAHVRVGTRAKLAKHVLVDQIRGHGIRLSATSPASASSSNPRSASSASARFRLRGR